jgi:hypothetical protein
MADCTDCRQMALRVAGMNSDSGTATAQVAAAGAATLEAGCTDCRRKKPAVVAEGATA